MSSPRDRFDDRDESSGWQEPAHLGGEGTGGDTGAGRDDGAGDDGARQGPDGPGPADDPDADRAAYLDHLTARAAEPEAWLP